MTDRPTTWRLSQLLKGYAFRAVVRRQIDMRLFEAGTGEE